MRRAEESDQKKRAEMKKRKKIILVGGGGHCKVIIDAIMSAGVYDIAGVVDPALKIGEQVLGISVLGDDSVLPGLYEKGVKEAVISVGSVGDPALRKKLYSQLKKLGFSLPVVIHPKAVVARDVKIGEGTFLAASVTVNPGTRIGAAAIINTSSSVDHDCSIGDFVHIAPGVTLSGGVQVGGETHIGTGAKVAHYTKIPARKKIKAGDLVYTDFQGDTQVRSIVRMEDKGASW